VHELARERRYKKKTRPAFQHTHTPHTKRKRRTGLCSKVNRPAEPRSVLDRINAIIRKRLQLADEPLPTPTTLIPQPQLLLQDLRALPGALARARITRADARADRARRLREPSEPVVQRRKEERKVRCGRRRRRQRCVRQREGIVRVCRFGSGRRRGEGRGEDEDLIRRRIGKEGYVREGRVERFRRFRGERGTRMKK